MTRTSAIELVCAGLFFVAGCAENPILPSDGKHTPDGGTAFVANCTALAPSDEAKKPAAASGSTSAILPGGRRIDPAGRLLDVGGYPIAFRVLPGDRYAVVSDDAAYDQALRVVDLAAADPLHPVTSSIAYPASGGKNTPGLFFGLALTPDGKRIYVSDGGRDASPAGATGTAQYNVIEAYDIAGQGGVPTLTRRDDLEIDLHFTATAAGFRQRLPSGIALSADGKTMFVACQGDTSLAIVSLAPGPTYGMEIGTAMLPGLAPYDVAVDEKTHTAFVSLWGGQPAGRGHFVEGVVPVDITDLKAPVAAAAPITTGKASEVELLFGSRLFVANADADTLSVIDTATKAVKTMPVTSSMILGASPTALAIDPGDGATRAGRVYITNSNENSVVVLDLDTLAIVGHIPTAWYPTAVAVRPSGDLLVAAARGMGSGPYDGKTPTNYPNGTIEVIARPTNANLVAGTRIVEDNLTRPSRVAPALTCPAGSTAKEQRFPLAAQPGAPSPLKYVFLIVRENKTYDSVFGDLDIGNGDPSLMAFTAEMVPNARAIAKTFVLLDNFYSHAELSDQGHEWTTGCIANDYVEKAWGAQGYGRGFRPEEALSASVMGRLGYPGSDSMWVHLDKLGIPYHNYGEVTNLLDALNIFDSSFPGLVFNTSVKDVKKAAYVLDNVLASGDSLEPFSYILLPNDHTDATKVGSSSPASMMADNDEAVGRFVNGISHSALWPESLIIVLQDDPGGLGDHVESHRSPCLLASPWLKRGYISSTNYDIGSVYRTIELVIGATPLNGYDANAAPMYELFSTTPDYTPFSYIPRKIPETMNQPGDPLSDESSRMDFSQPDQTDISRAIWKSTHGANTEPPWLERARTRPLVGAPRLGIVDPDGDGD